MKNISIIIEIYVLVHSSPGNVLRKHRVIPNVMVLYVFFYLRSLKAKHRSLVIRNIIRAVDKDKQLALTSILEAMMILKKAWNEVIEQTIRNCF